MPGDYGDLIVYKLRREIFKMAIIWKLELKIQASQVVEVPESCKVLSVGVQHGKPCVWIELDNDGHYVPLGLKTVTMIGTGVKFERYATLFIGSFVLMHDNLVLHAYWGK